MTDCRAGELCPEHGGYVRAELAHDWRLRAERAEARAERAEAELSHSQRHRPRDLDPIRCARCLRIWPCPDADNAEETA